MTWKTPRGAILAQLCYGTVKGGTVEQAPVLSGRPLPDTAALRMTKMPGAYGIKEDIARPAAGTGKRLNSRRVYESISDIIEKILYSRLSGRSAAW